MAKKCCSSFWWDVLQLLIKSSTISLQLSLKLQSRYKKKTEICFPWEIRISVYPNRNLWLFQSSLLAFNTDYIYKLCKSLHLHWLFFLYLRKKQFFTIWKDLARRKNTWLVNSLLRIYSSSWTCKFWIISIYSHESNLELIQNSLEVFS